MLTSSGLGLHFIEEGNLPYLLITAGSFIFAVSVKVTKIALIRERNELLNNKNKDNE